MGILENVVAQDWDPDWILLEDNDNSHGTRGNADNKCKQAKRRLGIKWEANPPESPDLNPIETIWRTVKQRLKNRGRQLSQSGEGDDPQPDTVDVGSPHVWIEDLVQHHQRRSHRLGGRPDLVQGDPIHHGRGMAGGVFPGEVGWNFTEDVRNRPPIKGERWFSDRKALRRPCHSPRREQVVVSAKQREDNSTVGPIDCDR